MKLNDATSHPSAFISSTFLDLQEERKMVAATLAEAGVNVNALDVQPTSGISARSEIVNGIKESDFVIVIVGDRYGSIVPQITFRTDISVTEWEYKLAIKEEKSVLAFFRKTNGTFSINEEDSLRLKRLKDELTNKHSPRYFSSAAELAKSVKGSLIRVYREAVKKHQKIIRLQDQTITERDGRLSGLGQELLNLKKSAPVAGVGLDQLASIGRPQQQPSMPVLGLSGLASLQSVPALGLSGLASPLSSPGPRGPRRAQ